MYLVSLKYHRGAQLVARRTRRSILSRFVSFAGRVSIDDADPMCVTLAHTPVRKCNYVRTRTAYVRACVVESRANGDASRTTQRAAGCASPRKYVARIMRSRWTRGSKSWAYSWSEQTHTQDIPSDVRLLTPFLLRARLDACSVASDTMHRVC